MRQNLQFLLRLLVFNSTLINQLKAILISMGQYLMLKVQTSLFLHCTKEILESEDH